MLVMYKAVAVKAIAVMETAIMAVAVIILVDMMMAVITVAVTKYCRVSLLTRLGLNSTHSPTHKCIKFAYMHTNMHKHTHTRICTMAC